MEKEFGFYPNSSELNTGPIRISPVAAFDRVLRGTLECGQINESWFYPPIVRCNATTPPKIGGISPNPLMRRPIQRFELPTTHVLSHRETRSEARLVFLIFCFGLFVGMKLVPSGWGHFYRTGICPFRLSDLVLGNSEIETCLSKADEFWLIHHRETGLIKQVLAAIHSFHSAQSYEHQHEQFIFLYLALDAVASIFETLDPKGFGRHPHWAKARALCNYLGIPKPIWTRPLRTQKPSSGLSKLRNKLFHEAMVSDEPFGLSVVAGHINVEICALLNRALLHAIGVRAPYISSPVTTLQMHGLNYS